MTPAEVALARKRLAENIGAAIARAAPPPPKPKRAPAGSKRGSEESRLRSAIVAALLKDPRVGWAHANIVRRTPYGWFGLGVGSADIVGMLRGCKGFACDCGRCHVGRALFVEVKLPDDPHPDEHQQKWLDDRKSDGAIVIVATSVEDAINGLP